MMIKDINVTKELSPEMLNKAAMFSASKYDDYPAPP
jgi:hypothetical protein